MEIIRTMNNVFWGWLVAGILLLTGVFFTLRLHFPQFRYFTRLFGNLALSMMMVHKAIPDTMPFLFPEVAEDMVDFQVRALVDEMERVKEHVR